MELSEFKNLDLRPVEADFHGLNLVVNVNAVTGRHYRDAAQKIRAAASKQDTSEKKRTKKAEEKDPLIAFEGRGEFVEAQCDLYATLLKGSNDEPLLMSWDLTQDGEPIPCTVEELRKRHPELLRELYQFCLVVDRPKSQETRTTATSRTTSDNTVATTPTPDTQTDAGPIM